MSYRFKAKIYKVGINPCVKVPASITKHMQPLKGYIPIKGMIDAHPFTQTLVPVRNEPYRLFVNGIMLKASGKTVGETAVFEIEQDLTPISEAYPIPAFLTKKLKAAGVLKAFDQQTPYRRKEVIRYLNYLKTEEARDRNINKLIAMLQK